MTDSEYQAFRNEVSSLLPELLSATFSKSSKDSEYKKIRLDKKNAGEFKVEKFTEKQAFQEILNIEETEKFFLENLPANFKNLSLTLSDGSSVYFLANKKGKLHKSFSKAQKNVADALKNQNQQNRIKSYILPEGQPVSFLIELGVMNLQGKVLAKSYDKFRQINRFLEFIKDILPELTGKEMLIQKRGKEKRHLSIIDFGCGKSYLTFAVYHYLTKISGLECDITGVDLKADIIKECSALAEKCGYSGLKFFCGDIADWKEKTESPVDLVMTLHACDTATDYALDFAVKHKARVILSVPCCQHELNNVLSRKEMQKNASEQFAPLLKHGIIRDKFLSLVTDVMRSELLEQYGYKVQLLEFIDMEHTPKNVLIRAVKREISSGGDRKKSSASPAINYENLKQALGASVTLEKLLSAQS